jgi:hypothetical protein
MHQGLHDWTVMLLMEQVFAEVHMGVEPVVAVLAVADVPAQQMVGGNMYAVLGGSTAVVLYTLDA